MDKGKKEKRALRLYVAGTSARSSLAISNIKNICEQYFSDGYELEVVDIYQQPELAEEENIIAAPTLIRKLPPPMRRVVGDMSDTNRVVVMFMLDAQD
ncbi:MAG: circadian clock KaiB family protein [Rhodospirillaceae bacterium]